MISRNYSIGLLALLGIAWVEPACAQAPLQSKQIIKEVGIDQHLNAQLPLDAVLRDEQGHQVRLGEFFGKKPVILNFVYYRCPMLCTQVLNGLLRSSQGLKYTLHDDFDIVSISIDPRETPEMAAAKKKKYVASYRREGGEEGWHFLTADEATIEQLASIAGFRYRYDAPSNQYAHASGIMIVNPEGRISHYFYGIDYSPVDLRLALTESSENRIGNLVDQVLLLCYHYDPATGKYGFAISAVLRLAGTATLLILGLFLLRMFALERRRSLANLVVAAAAPPPPAVEAN